MASLDNTAFRLRHARPAFSPLRTYVQLKDLGSATAFDVEPAEYWKDPGARAELASGRIVVGTRFEKDMPDWEMHPSGDELLVALSGEYEVWLQDGPGSRSSSLSAGQVLVVPFGVWHRLCVKAPGEVLSITPRKGTQHRPS